jgi:hypothetical protein
MMLLLLLVLLASASGSSQAAPAPTFDCKVFNCTCQGFADYYGAISGVGWGCVPQPAGKEWWSAHGCSARTNGSHYCDGPACKLSGHAPCQSPPGPPAPSPPSPPSPPARQCSEWSTNSATCLEHYDVVWPDLLPETGPTWVNTMPIGNGEYAANVWFDQHTGTFSALLASTGAWSEGGELLKIALLNGSRHATLTRTF